MLAAWCGPRFDEIAALRVDRVDFARRQIRVEETLAEVSGRLHMGLPKTKVMRSVAAPAFVIDAVAAPSVDLPAGAGQSRVFVARGRPRSPDELQEPGLGACGPEGRPGGRPRCSRQLGSPAGEPGWRRCLRPWSRWGKGRNGGPANSSVRISFTTTDVRRVPPTRRPPHGTCDYVACADLLVGGPERRSEAVPDADSGRLKKETIVPLMICRC